MTKTATVDNYIRFYPTPSEIVAFSEKLSDWKHSKGAIQFPITKEIPYEIIEEIIKFRYNENSIK